MPVNQVIIQMFWYHQILLNIKIQSHSAKNSCVKQVKVLLIVAIDSIPLHIDLMYILVQNLRLSLDIL